MHSLRPFSVSRCRVRNRILIVSLPLSSWHLWTLVGSPPPPAIWIVLTVAILFCWDKSYDQHNSTVKKHYRHHKKQSHLLQNGRWSREPHHSHHNLAWLVWLQKQITDNSLFLSFPLLCKGYNVPICCQTSVVLKWEQHFWNDRRCDLGLQTVWLVLLTF